MKRAIVAAAVAVLVGWGWGGAALADGRTITVDDDGAGDFSTIQAAIDDSNDGDTVLVADGTYTGDGNRDIDFHGKAITVISENGPENCIIDCNGSEGEPHRGFYFHSGEGLGSVLSGVTVTNGYAYEGGGISCKGADPTISNCTFVGNSAEGGGAMFIRIWPEDADPTSYPVVSSCTFSGNSADHGGAASIIYDGNSQFDNCTFSGNLAHWAGGAISNCANTAFSNCDFVNNSAGEYGGAFDNWGGGEWTRPTPTLISCSFTGNSARNGGGMCNRSQGGDIPYPTLISCTFTANLAVNGGGIYNWNFTVAELSNCVFTANGADSGGAICNSAPYGPYIISMLTNCTFRDNFAVYTGGAIYKDEDTRLRLTKSILWGNWPDEIGEPFDNIYARYSNIRGGWPGEGNIDVDPLFVELGYWDENGTLFDESDDFWVEGDYHVKSQGGRWDDNSGTWVIDDVTSPCIDAGDPMDPIGHEPFPNGGIINMGAYGGTVEASKSYFGKPTCEMIAAGDINGDCIVDFRDFRLIALHWMEEH